jgi:hypothetical protein
MFSENVKPIISTLEETGWKTTVMAGEYGRWEKDFDGKVIFCWVYWNVDDECILIKTGEKNEETK